MGTCSSAPRLKLRALIPANPPSEVCCDGWYIDTMNVLLGRWAASHVQFLRRKFIEATGDDADRELDKKGFFKLFAELQDMPQSIAESAFRMFDADQSGKLNFREFCCALALCCHLMGSDDEKIRFVFDMFDTNDDGILSANDLQLLLEHALPQEKDEANAEDSADSQSQRSSSKSTSTRRQLRVAEIKQELLGRHEHLSFEEFYEWASRNLESLNNLLHTFQIVPSPQRERAICEEILAKNLSLREGSTWYCISHKWLQVWKAHANWRGPPTGRLKRKVSLTSVNSGEMQRLFSKTSISNIWQEEEEFFSDEPPINTFYSESHAHHSSRPPEIDNSDLEGEHKGELKMNLVEHLDYELIPEEMWLRLVEWYGGGPAIRRKVICMGHDHQPQVELYPPLLLVVAAGENGQPMPQFSRRFFISRQSPMKDVLHMLAERLSRPVERSRLWHKAKGEQWRLVEQSSSETITLEEFLQGKVCDAGTFMLETQTPQTKSQAPQWPRDALVAPELDCLHERELRHVEVGDCLEAMNSVTGQWMRGTIVDAIQRDDTSAPSQVKVHYDSTVYKCDEWISLTSHRLAPLDTHTTHGVEMDGTPSAPLVRGATGLQNLGNTCFINATVQCMANTPLLREYFLSSQHLRDLAEKGISSKGKLAEEFGSLLASMWAGTNNSVAPWNLKRTIDQLAPQFAGYEQHDAQEFLALFLDGLHEDLNRSPPSSVGKREGLTPKIFSSSRNAPMFRAGLRETSSRQPVMKNGSKTAWRDRGSDPKSAKEEEANSAAGTSSVSGSGIISVSGVSTGSVSGKVPREINLDAPSEQSTVDGPPLALLAGDQGFDSFPGLECSNVSTLDESNRQVHQTILWLRPRPDSPPDGSGQSTWSKERTIDAWPCQDKTNRAMSDILEAHCSENTSLTAAASKLSRREGELSKQQSNSRWWRSAWRRGRGVLDLPKDSSAEVSIYQEGMQPREGGATSSASTTPDCADTDSRPKHPAGSAGAAVAAAAANRVEFPDDGDNGGVGYHESEDFVPELLSPDKSSSRRSLKMFGLGWRKRHPEDEGGTSPSAGVGKKTRTPPIPSMTPLHEERTTTFSTFSLSPVSDKSVPVEQTAFDSASAFALGDDASLRSGCSPSEHSNLELVSEGVEHLTPLPLHNVGSSAYPDGSAHGAASIPKTLRPWRTRSQKRNHDRDLVAEPVGMIDSSFDGLAASRDEGHVGRGRERESAWPSFLRRSKSREGSGAGRRPLPVGGVRAGPSSHKGDLPIHEPNRVEVGAVSADEGDIKSASTCQIAGITEPNEDKRLTSSMGLAFLRGPWKRSDAAAQPSSGGSMGDSSTSSRTKHAEDAHLADSDDPPADASAAVVRPTSKGPVEGTELDVLISLVGNGKERSPCLAGGGTLMGEGVEGSALVESPRLAVVDTDQHVVMASGATQSTGAQGVLVEKVDPSTEKASEVTEDNLPDEEKATRQWERYRAANRSLIVDIFEGQLRSQLTCLSCGATSSTFEPFRYLSVPIPSNHVDKLTLRVVFFPLPFVRGDHKPHLTRYTFSVPKSSTIRRMAEVLSRRLPVPLESVCLAEVYRSRIHRYLEPSLTLSDIRSEDQLFAFEVLQSPAELMQYQERYAPWKHRRDTEDVKKLSMPCVLLIQAMHRRVVDVCRSDGRTWAQRREVFGLPFVMSACSTWSYATLHDMLMLHARRFLKAPRTSTVNHSAVVDPPTSPTSSTSGFCDVPLLTPHKALGASSSAPMGDERASQIPFVARIVNSSGTACGACDRRNCSGCLLPKGNARLRLRAGLMTGGVGSAKIYLALDWVDNSVYDQEYIDALRDDEAAADQAESDEVAFGSESPTKVDAETASGSSPRRGTGSGRSRTGRVPISACIDAFAEPEFLRKEFGNGIKCDKCGEVVDAMKRLEIWREPDVLILHIKRFSFGGVHYEKLNTLLDVPCKELSLRPWMARPGVTAQSCSYDLFAVTCHLGGMSGGHYTSYCSNDQGNEPVWLKFNDEVVTGVAFDQELDEISNQCYVLFLRKRSFTSSNLINYASFHPS